MNKKVVIAMMSGILAAGVLCFIVGIIVFYAMPTVIVARVVAIFTMAIGCMMSLMGLIVLVTTLIIVAITKRKNNNGEKND